MPNIFKRFLVRNGDLWQQFPQHAKTLLHTA